MSHGRRLLFSINEYDRDGDLCEPGVFLYWQDARIHIARDAREWEAFKESVARLIAEVDERREELKNPQSSEA